MADLGKIIIDFSTPIIIVVAVFIIQIIAYRNIKKKHSQLKNVFPERPGDVISLNDNNNVYTIDEEVIIEIKEDARNVSTPFRQIISSFNNYLVKNEGSAEFSVLKDITDRNSDVFEQQINSTSAVPIYLGLCGTLIGIVFGVGVLGFGGGLDMLMSNETGINADADADGGIRNLLCGVAIAMSTTLSGVILSIIGAHSLKATLEETGKRKNLFLNWVQENLLPEMDDGMAGTLKILQKNLSKFNKDFSANAKNLKDSLETVVAANRERSNIFKEINKLKIEDIAEANIKVLNEFQRSTQKLNDLQNFLNKSDRYLTKVENLNNEINQYLYRTELIEKLCAFFKNEFEDIASRKSAIIDAVQIIDQSTTKALERLGESTKQQFEILRDNNEKQIERFTSALQEQQIALESSISSSVDVLNGLNSLKAVSDSVEKLLEVTMTHNEQSAKLISQIEKMGNSHETPKNYDVHIKQLIDAIKDIRIDSPEVTPIPQENNHLPKWVIIVFVFTQLATISTCVGFVLKFLL